MQPQFVDNTVKVSIPYQAQRWLAIPTLGSLSLIILALCGYHVYDSYKFVSVEQAYLNPPRQAIKSVQSGKVSKLTISPNAHVRQGQVVAYITPTNLPRERQYAITNTNSEHKIPILANTSGRIVSSSIPLRGLSLTSGDEIMSISSCKPMIDFIVNQRQARDIRRGARVYFKIGDDTYKGSVDHIHPYRLGMKISNLTYQEPLAQVNELKQASNLRGIVKLDAVSEAQFHENIGACNFDVQPFKIKILKR